MTPEQVLELRELISKLQLFIDSIEAPAPVAPPEIPSMGIDTLAAELPPTLPPALPPEDREIEISIAPADAIALAANPVPEIPSVAPCEPVPSDISAAPTPSREIVILSLSTSCAVPSVFDQALEVSQLQCTSVERIGEMVCFTYCGMEFKYPAEPHDSSAIVCNSPKNIQENSIRVALKFADGSGVTYPCLLNVIKGSSNVCQVVLGKDLSELAQLEGGSKGTGNPNDQVPTQ